MEVESKYFCTNIPSWVPGTCFWQKSSTDGPLDWQKEDPEVGMMFYNALMFLAKSLDAMLMHHVMLYHHDQI